MSLSIYDASAHYLLAAVGYSSDACHDRYEVQVNECAMTYTRLQVDSTCAERLKRRKA